MHPVPDALRAGPFTRQQARTAGVTRHMLEGRRFVRELPGVWRYHLHEMTHEDRVAAAALALPDDARLTGITRIQQLGLHSGPVSPVRFVLPRDHHIALPGVFLHRTKSLAPNDGHAIGPAGSFIAFCGHARTIDAIKVGDWLLHHKHMTITELQDLAVAELWRLGAIEAAWVSHHLNGRSRSLPESELRAFIEFSGLPTPLVNERIRGLDDRTALGDLEIRPPGLAIEYEGEQHQADRAQYLADLDRYEALRRSDHPYLQVTKESIARPRLVVNRIHRAMVELGYEGPAPDFTSDRWHQLTCPLRAAVGDRGPVSRWER